jgi:hypothetical protein
VHDGRLTGLGFLTLAEREVLNEQSVRRGTYVGFDDRPL